MINSNKTSEKKTEKSFLIFGIQLLILLTIVFPARQGEAVAQTAPAATPAATTPAPAPAATPATTTPAPAPAATPAATTPAPAPAATPAATTPAPAPAATPAAATPAPAPTATPAATTPAPAPAETPTAEETAAAKQRAIEKVERVEPVPVPSEKPADAASLAQKVEAATKEELKAPSEADKKAETEVVLLTDYDPKKSFSQLLYPHIAERVGLTVAQQKKINDIMVERASQLAKAEKKDWNNIVKESEKDLKALLSAQQLERFEQGQVEKKIILRFSKENWADVLKWFAAEVGLQLVMDAPPPGTLNYNDKNQYTPKEALDIINGALQFKGYTLFRYGEMLIVHNFQNGPIPLQYLPKVTVEELQNLARFDYAAVTVPLESRDLQQVLQAIQPFQSPYTFIRKMTGNSLLIVDSASSLREITEAALAVHNPVSAATASTPPVYPEWRSYYLKGTRPSVVKEQVALFAPEAKALINPDSSQISFLATPPVLAVIDGLVQRLEKGGDLVKGLVVAVYPIEKMVNVSPVERWILSRRLSVSQLAAFTRNSGSQIGEEIVAALKKIAPEADITLNDISKQIIVIAAQVDHDRITKVFDTLKKDPAKQELPVIKVYQFKSPKLKPDETVQDTIKTILPDLQIVYDEQRGSMLVIATAQEHEMLAKAMTELEANLLQSEKEMVLSVYPMTVRQRTRFDLLYKQLAKENEMQGIVLLDDAADNQLCVWATAEQQEAVRKLIDQIITAQYSEWERKLNSNPVPTPVLSELTGKTSALADAAKPAAEPAKPAAEPAKPAAEPAKPVAEPAKPVAEPAKPVAEPAKPAAEPAKPAAEPAKPAAEPAKQVESQLGDSILPFPGSARGVCLTIYRLKNYSLAAAESILSNTIPGIEITRDAPSDSLILLGTKSMLQAAISVLDNIERNRDLVFKVVPVNSEFPYLASYLLPRIEPSVYSRFEPASLQVVMYGDRPSVERAEKFIKDIMKSSPEEERGIYYIKMDRDLPSTVLTYIQRLAPRTQVNYNAETKQFIIFGSPSEQLVISKLLTEAEQNLPKPEETQFFDFERPVSDKIIQLIRDLNPDVHEIRKDSLSPTLLIIKADPDKMEGIRQTVDKVKKEYPWTNDREVAGYPITDEGRARFKQIQSEFERENGAITILNDEESPNLIIWATSRQHVEIKKLLDQFDKIAPKEKIVPVLYNPQYVDLASLSKIIGDIYPKLKIVSDTSNNRLVIYGVQEDQKEVQEMLAKIDVKDERAPKRYFESYFLRSLYLYDSSGSYVSPFTFIAKFEQLVPGAKVNYDYRSRQMVVYGTEEEQKQVAEAISKLEKKKVGESTIFRYQPRHLAVTTLYRLISNTFYSISPTLDSASESIIIRLPEGAENLKAELEEFCNLVDPQEPGPNAPILKIYPLATEPTDDMITGLKRLVPDVEMIKADSDRKQIIVIAKKSVQETVESNIKSIAENFTDAEQKLVVYPIFGMEPEQLETSIAKIYPKAKIEVDDRGKRLLIWAGLTDHIKISEEIARINDEKSEGNEGENGQKVCIYNLENGMVQSQILDALKTLVPAAEVFSNPVNVYTLKTPQRLTILASVREHKQIVGILEQFKNADTDHRAQLACYPFGNANPTTVETMLQGMFPDADSLSGPEVRQGSLSRSRLRNPYAPQEDQPFFRVDPKSRTVAVFASLEEQMKVRKAIETIAQMSETEAKLISKVYTLQSPIASQLIATIAKAVPTAQATVISPKEIAAYATKADLDTIDSLIEGIAGTELNPRREMRILRIPEGLRYPRMRLIGIMSVLFRAEDGYIYPGAQDRDIIVWGDKATLDKIFKFFETTFKEADKEIYRKYPIQHIAVAKAVRVLERLCPNSTVTPDETDRAVTVFATPLEHEQIADAIKQVDSIRSGDEELLVRYYQFHSNYSIYGRMLYRSLVTQFPHIVIIPDFETGQMTVTATNKEHEKIAVFCEELEKNHQTLKGKIEVYYLQNVNALKVLPILRQTVPGAYAFLGKTPNELYIWGNTILQEDVRHVLAKLETVEEGKPGGLLPKIYKVARRIATTATAILTPQLPGCVIYPLANDRIIIWGSASDQKLASSILEVVAEAYPEPVLQKYPLKHLRYVEISSFLSLRFGADAIFYPSQNGDLFCNAAEDVQKKVAELLKAVDVAESEEAGRIAAVYDISRIPLVSRANALANLRYLSTDLLILPTSADGYFLAYGKPPVQKKIAEMIKMMVTESPHAKGRLETYTLKKTTYAQTVNLLIPIVPNVRFGIGTEANQLIAWANNEDHKTIASVLEKMNADMKDGPVPVIYSLKNVAPLTAYYNVLSLFPTVITIPDSVNQTLMVKAMKEDHEKIAAFLSQIDHVDEENKKSVQVFNLGSINYAQFAAMIQGILYGEPGFTFQYDVTSKSLVVKGSERQRDIVRQLIEELRKGGMADSEATLATYTIKNPYITYTIRRLFIDQGRDLFYYNDYQNGKLIVLGRPEEHDMIKKLLEATEPEGTQLAIFDLVYVAPETAQFVIVNMLESDGTMIDVQYDSLTSQLYIRGTARRLEEIRQLLIRMGEKGLEKMKPITDEKVGNSGSNNDLQGFKVRISETLPVHSTNSTETLFDKKQKSGITENVVVTNTPSTSGATSSAPSSSVSSPVKNTDTWRTIKINGDAQKVIDEIQKIWNRSNKINVIKEIDNSELIQTREDSAPATPAPTAPATKPADVKAPAVTPAPATPAPTAPATKPVEVKAPAVTPAPATPAPTAPATKPADVKAPAVTPAPATPAPTAPATKPADVKAPAVTPAPATPAPTAPATKPADVKAPAVTPAPATPAPTAPAAKPAEVKKATTIQLPDFKNFFFNGKTLSGLSLINPLRATMMGVVVAGSNSKENHSVSNSAEKKSQDSVPVQKKTTVGKTTDPGVYVIVNKDGTLTLTSHDKTALDDLQKKIESLGAVISTREKDSSKNAELKSEKNISAPAEVPSFSGSQSTAGSEIVVKADTLNSQTKKDKIDSNKIDKQTTSDDIHLMTMLDGKREEGRKKIVMEGRDFTVFKIENVNVSIMLPRLQTYMANRIAPTPPITSSPYSINRGINFGTINHGPRIVFTPDLIMNTIHVRGSKVDREETGAMIAVLDKTELFPAPITKPYKVRVRNAPVNRVAQQVLVVFQRKLMMTRLPGNEVPRISPNPTTSTLEIYAPESLAKEIETYVLEMDEEIIKDPVRKVHVIELKDINSLVLQRYITNLRQTNMMMYYPTSPYMMNPYFMYNQRASRSF